MDRDSTYNKTFYMPSVFRKFLLSWLTAVTAEYIMVPDTLKNLQVLDGLAQMSLIRVLILAAVFFSVLCILNRPLMERWLMTAMYAVLAIVSLSQSFSWPFLVVNLLIVSILICYSVRGWNSTAVKSVNIQADGKLYPWITAAVTIAFFLFVSIWTVFRVFSFSTPTFDFGIFSQMFYNMKTSGLPMTTVERDGLLSHFHVHMSPIYYFLLPFYCLFPYPATLQVLQAAVLASAVIPLWKIGRHHGLSPVLSALLCTLLLLYPAYSGGASYDIHENAFLTPLILWLFYSIDKKSSLLTGLFGVLVLMIKEDAAVYVAIIALYFLLHGLLRKDRWETQTSIFLAGMSIIWFVVVTDYLANTGDGVMTYRYSNFIYDHSGSLITVIKAVLMCPMKAVLECVDQEKLQFIALTVLPLAALPFFTRRYERYILLIPYILINLMSDYQYQHDIFFQYTFGSTACLFYITAVNLSDIKLDHKRFAALSAALCICLICFINLVVPKAVAYPKKYALHADHYSLVEETLSLIPDGASVSTTTFYTTYLSQRPVLYDIQYASQEHILSTEYIVLSSSSESAYKKYSTDGENGFENITELLLNSGYTLFAEMEGTLIIYQKPA